MSDLLITGGRIFDPAAGIDQTAALLLQAGQVAALGAADTLRAQAPGAPEFAATGLLVTPGFIDLHAHFREPGQGGKETIASGARAAAAGGFTTVCCMANTKPALDSEALMNFVLREARQAQAAEVLPVGALTAARQGRELAEMASMARGGAAAFSDDGATVANPQVLRQAMLYAKMLDKPVLEHCEDLQLAAGGVMNEGVVSTVLGLPGIPAEAEEIIVARDILLAKLTGARLHLQHISTRGSIALISQAKAAGLPVTAEVTPHHLTLTEENLRGFDPVYKVSPPLRTVADQEACVAALASGVLDCVATDHAPHLAEEKELELAAAPCGIIGLESALGVLLTKLVRPGKLSLARLVTALTSAPGKLLGGGRGSLAVGAPGNVTLLDLEKRWTLAPAEFFSQSTNCPWAGEELCGRVAATVVGGKVVYQHNPVLSPA